MFWRTARLSAVRALMKRNRSLTTATAVPSPSRHERNAFDSLAFTMHLEASGVPRRQAEALATTVLDVIASADASYRTELASKDQIAQCRNELSIGLETQRAVTQRDIDRIRTESEKLRTELKYEIEKLNTAQRLDFNLEKGRIRDELQKQTDRILEIDARLDREANLIRTQIEAGKNDLLRYSVGTLISFGAVALGALRLML
jgi:hypothetical protein